MIARPQGELAPPSGVYQRHRLGDDLQLVGQREGVVRAHVLVEAHAHALGVAGAQLSDAQLAVDHQLRRRPQPGDALPDLAGRRLLGRQRAHRGRAGEHRRAVALFGPQARRALTGGRDLHEGTHLLAFDHHVLVVRAEAAAFEPGVAEQLEQQRLELAEMRGPFDRPGTQPQRRGGGVVVDRLVAVVDLFGQHLPRLAPAAAEQGQFSVGRAHGCVGCGRGSNRHCGRGRPVT